MAVPHNRAFRIHKILIHRAESRRRRNRLHLRIFPEQVCHFLDRLPPRALVHFQRRHRFHLRHHRRLREIVNRIRVRAELFQRRKLLRVSVRGCLVRLIRQQPDLPPQRNGVIIQRQNRRPAHSLVEEAVLLVLPNPHHHAQHAQMLPLRIQQRAKRRLRIVIVHILHAVFDVIRRLHPVHLQSVFRSVQLRQQRLQKHVALGHLVRFRRRSISIKIFSGCSPTRPHTRSSRQQRQSRKQTHRALRVLQPAHGFTPVESSLPPSTPGAGNIGGRSRPCARFCTSISLNSIAGATADTGTLPLSAPQTPLNTCCVSPVVIIRVNAASGVPTMSTPRTSSSGRPSAYTLYTITGST